MADIYLAYSPETRANYYGDKPLARLQALGEVRLNRSETPLTPADLVREAAGCDIIVASRIPAATAEVFDRLPQLVAYCRGAVDIRNIDVVAAAATAYWSRAPRPDLPPRWRSGCWPSCSISVATSASRRWRIATASCLQSEWAENCAARRWAWPATAPSDNTCAASRRRSA
nr:hypothetical protein [Herbaspirillum sp. RV1423]